MECSHEKEWSALRNEVNEQNKNYSQEKHSFGSKLKIATFAVKASIFSQYVLCLSRQIEAVPSHGFACRRRSTISYGSKTQV